MRSVLSPVNLSEIKNVIQDELTKRGINAPIREFKEIECDGDINELKFYTDNFQTIPVLFKNIRVRGLGYIRKNKGLPTNPDVEYLSVTIGLDHDVVYFDSGTNGIGLLYAEFRVFDIHEGDVHLIKIK